MLFHLIALIASAQAWRSSMVPVKLLVNTQNSRKQHEIKTTAGQRYQSQFNKYTQKTLPIGLDTASQQPNTSGSFPIQYTTHLLGHCHSRRIAHWHRHYEQLTRIQCYNHQSFGPPIITTICPLHNTANDD